MSWPAVYTNNLGHTKVTTHQIHTEDEIQIRKRAYPVPFYKQEVVEAKVKKMLELGVIRPSTSPWASLVVLVKKKVGELLLH